MFKFCTSSNLLFYHELLIGTQPTVLECIVIFLQSDWSTMSNVFERRTSTGSGLFALLSNDFKPMFGQIVFIRIKTLGNTNTVVLRLIKREKSSLPVVVRRSKTSLHRVGSTGIPQCSTMLKFRLVFQTGGKLRENRLVWSLLKLPITVALYV